MALDRVADPNLSSFKRLILGFPSVFARPFSLMSVTSLLGIVILLSIAGQLAGVFRRNINWDEFLFLTNIYRAANGEALGLLQTTYVHVFAWMTAIPGDEIAAITIARLTYVALWVLSLGLLYRLALRLLDPIAAVAGTVFFALFSYSVTHAASFRIDGLMLPILISAALLLTEPTTRHTAAAGALCGAALALSVKAILWAPAFAGLLAIGLLGRRERLAPVLAGALAGSLAFCGIMLAHYLLLSSGNGASPGISARSVSNIGFRMLAEEGLFPRAGVLIRSVFENGVTWTLLLLGLVLTVLELRTIHRRNEALQLLFLGLPIFAVGFYANAWPYAYLVLFPAACLMAGRGFSWLMEGPGILRPLVAIACVAVAAMPLAKSGWELRTDQRASQKEVLDIVHSLFPQPVAYIDRTGMVASFPRPIFFMTRWGMKNYTDARIPVLANYIRREGPPLLITNTRALQLWETGEAEQPDPRLQLLPKDQAILRATYAHFWGPIYLAGRKWSNLLPGEIRDFEITIPGAYTLLAKNDVVIDGRTYAPGATLTIGTGLHELRTYSAEADLRLLWGKAIRIPTEQPSPLPMFAGL